MKIAAWFCLILNAVYTIVVPFAIGQPRRPIGPQNCVGAMLGLALSAAVCGRVLGWW